MGIASDTLGMGGKMNFLGVHFDRLPGAGFWDQHSRKHPELQKVRF